MSRPGKVIKPVRFAYLNLAVVLVLVLPAFAAAQQWTTDGNNINNTNTGNVGVGTTTPSTKLHVAGGIYSSTSVEAYVTNGFRLVGGPGDPRATWTYYGGATTNRITGILNVKTSLGSNGVDDRLFLDLTGKVGIGTTTPGSWLHLRSGTDSATSFLLFDTGVHGGSNFTVGGTANNESTFDLSVYRAGTYSSRFGVNSAGNIYLQPAGGTSYVGIGTTSPTERLDVSGNLKVSGTISGGVINAKYQDVAEWVDSPQELPAGTVVVLDSSKSNQVIASNQSYDSRVAGVISRQPGLTLGTGGEGRVLVAATGRVKVKVDASAGPIQIGDLLVTSDKEGVAMKSMPVEIGGVRIHRPGTLIGKALEPLAQGTGEILVLLSLQ